MKTKPLYALIVALVAASPLGLDRGGNGMGRVGPRRNKERGEGRRSPGFVPAGMEKGFHFPRRCADYAVKGASDILGYVVSAILGVAVFIIAFKLLGLLKKDKRDESARAGA